MHGSRLLKAANKVSAVRTELTCCPPACQRTNLRKSRAVFADCGRRNMSGTRQKSNYYKTFQSSLSAVRQTLT
jgi:hypothetical protein